MLRFFAFSLNSKLIFLSILVLVLISLFTLRSVAFLSFDSYFVVVLSAFLVFYFFSKIDFEIFWSFSKHLYYLAIFLLIVNLIIGSVTRGVIRWIPLGSFAFQPSEIIRPFLLLYFSYYLWVNQNKKHVLIRSFGIFLIPFILILVQPSFGVAFLTAVGYLGVVIASQVDKRKLFGFLALGVFVLPLLFFILKPYQKERLLSFLNPWENSRGSGYNSVQSMISVGSGGVLGRGLGEGIGTQLKFLPEKNTDFIFASISEEMGFVGDLIVLVAFTTLYLAIVNLLEESVGGKAKSFIAGTLLTFLVQTFINIGMNTGILPITGVPLPFVSQGGSSLIASMIAISLSLNARNSIVLRQT